MLPTVYLAAVALPLLLTVVAVGMRLGAAVGVRIDASRRAPRPVATVTELPVADRPGEADAAPVLAPEAAPEPRTVQSGPLQLVDDERPSTKRCPDCAETVLASARVCKHCHFRFEPPLQGSFAV